MKEQFSIVSFYRFIDFDKNSLQQITSDLEELAKKHFITGLIISAFEGLNGTVASTEKGIEEFTKFLSEYSNGLDWKFKHSKSSIMPFKRFNVRFRPEIVTSGNENLRPNSDDDSHISCEEWHKYLTSSDKNYYLIDVRNDYEVEIGKFKGAINPETKDFKEFPTFVQNSNIPKDAEILMYCTGGIRCEKASLEMKELGYQNVKQLDGGILTYIEKYPNGEFEGECFVFDDRVALDGELKPSTAFSLCPHCGDTASQYIDCMNCGTKKKVCLDCQAEEIKKTCSKNCRYHYSRKLNGNKEKMKKSVSSVCSVVFVLFCFIASFAQQSSAESVLPGSLSPEDAVKSVISEIKIKGDPSPIVNHVDWDDSFKKLAAKNKEVMGVESADDLKEFYRKILLSPSTEIENMFQSKFKDKLNGLEPEKVTALLSSIKQKAIEKENEIKQRIKDSEYVVGKAEITGDTAEVPLTTNYKNTKNTDKVKLVKVDGKWLFASLGDGFSMKDLSGTTHQSEQQPMPPKTK